MKSHILCNLLLLLALFGDFGHARMFWMGSSQVNKDAPAAFNNGRPLVGLIELNIFYAILDKAPLSNNIYFQVIMI